MAIYRGYGGFRTVGEGSLLDLVMLFAYGLMHRAQYIDPYVYQSVIWFIPRNQESSSDWLSVACHQKDFRKAKKW